MKNAFEEIPQDLLDAARVDGGSELYIFFRIMLPLALPQIAALVILTAVTTWNNFLWPSVVLTKSDLMPLAVGILELSGTFGSSTRVIAAGAVLTIAPALIVFFLTQRFFMRGMEGAISERHSVWTARRSASGSLRDGGHSRASRSMRDKRRSCAGRIRAVVLFRHNLVDEAARAGSPRRFATCSVRMR